MSWNLQFFVPIATITAVNIYILRDICFYQFNCQYAQIYYTSVWSTPKNGNYHIITSKFMDLQCYSVATSCFLTTQINRFQSWCMSVPRIIMQNIRHVFLKPWIFLGRTSCRACRNVNYPWSLGIVEVLCHKFPCSYNWSPTSSNQCRLSRDLLSWGPWLQTNRPMCYSHNNSLITSVMM